MSNNRFPFGQGDMGGEEFLDSLRRNLPGSAQEWIDRATGQGTPRDYQPPVPPGHDATVPPPGANPGGAPTGSAPSGSSPRGGTGPGQSGGENHRVIDTSSAKGDGLDKCPRCGSTEIVLHAASGMLTCQFCRHQWSEATLEQKFGFDSPIKELHGRLLGSGASNQPESAESVVTLKCTACGAEVVVNTDAALQARCHWCRNTLSINQQMPNGAVPDGLLPFSITKDDAIARIETFVKSRKFFAHPQFIKEFAPSEVVGVYLPYLTMDANVSVELQGSGEIQTGRRTVKRGDTERTVYDADVYRLGRKFDMFVDDIQLESSQQRADQDTSRNTNNIINAILPFDVKHSVTYNANYLRGYTSERRDLRIDDLHRTADERVLSVGRSRASQTITRYDRGVRWEREALTVHGTRWLALYVPVWLYSYYQDRGNGRGLVHYVAVNGRNGETMGSVPVRQGRLVGISVAIGVVGTIVGGVLAFALALS